MSGCQPLPASASRAPASVLGVGHPFRAMGGVAVL